MRIYLRALAIVLVFLVSFGFVLPAVVSAASTELLVVAVLFAAVISPAVVWQVTILLNEVFTEVRRND